MKATPTGAVRHPRLKKRLVFDDEYMITEEEISAVFERWRATVAENPETFQGIEPETEEERETDARYFLDTLAAIRCERIGL